MKILVADDDATTRRVLGAALGRLGHDAIAVADGLAAWDALVKPDGPSLALLDWTMPGLDGPEICRRIRALAGARHYHLVLVTGRSEPDAIVAGFEAGADDFITKPVDLGELRARVHGGVRSLELHAEHARTTAYLLAVLANIRNGVVLTDQSGTVVFANRAFSELCEVPAESIVGRPRAEVLRADTGRFLRPRVHGQGPAEVAADFDVVRPEPRTIRWTSRPIGVDGSLAQLDVYRDVTLEVRREREQAREARFDALTQLQNRRGGEEVLARECVRAQKTLATVGLAVVDLDDFKQINDTLGHAAGDDALRRVASAMRALAPAGMTGVRWGGDELLAILPGATLDATRAYGEAVRAAVAAELGGGGTPTVSVGTAVVEVGEADASAALARADQALYGAKGRGRNCVV
jgi:diguanylate cyclase (GGDEF)-like protein